MQSAFVDLGLERDTFLYVSDFFEENGEEFDRIDAKPPKQSSSPVRHEPITITPVIDEPVIVPEEIPEVVAAEPVEVEESEKVEEQAAPAGGQDQRDRRGRRGRRRRTRGRGFPDSKYASDLTPPSTSEEIAAPVTDEEEPVAAEVFLLPGESLAKYSSRSAADREPSAIHADELDAPLSVDSIVEENSEETLIEERFEAGQIDAFEEKSTPAEEVPVAVEPEPIRSFVVEPEAAVPQPAQAIEPLEAPPEVVASSFPDAAYFTTPITSPLETLESSPIEEDRKVEFEESAAAESSVASYEETVTDGAADEDETEIDTDEDADGDDGIEEPPADSEGEQAPVEEPTTEEPLQASVREQGNRYQHRSSRRMRRRGRGGDRGSDRNAERGGERAAETREVRSPQQQAEVVDDRRSALPSITELLKEGQEIIVQIAKEPLGQKGARITSHIALPGRYVVYMPTVEHMGVSRKIASDEERQRLKKILQAHRPGITGGFILRTAGEGHTDEEIGADMAYLYNLWLDIRQKAEKKPAPLLLHHDLEIVQRILRDQLSDMYKTIWVDNEDIYESTVRFMQRFQPALVNRVKMYTRSAPIFDAFGITNEIEKALRPKVWLKSGGYIVINQTEALVAVDVNTGKYVGKSNRLEDTITKTNTEAVKEIVRQIRLRDLGGIIVVDFIDMDERKNRQKVMQTLEEAMRSDRAPYKILQFNDFGLVAITRKRVKQSLERSVCAPCPTCEGAGYTKSVTTVAGEILQEAMKLRSAIEGGKNIVVRTHPEVAKFLKSNSNDYLEELESIVGRPVMVKSDPTLHPEKFDLAV
jgi:ribonuclease G